MGSIIEVAKSAGNIQSLEDPRRSLLYRLAAGASFAKAPRLRELLLYLGESALQKPPSALTEQQVGVAVFGRPQGYDTSADTIVRVQASEIRKRLKYYFAAQGLQESIIMDLPRGSYVPIFYYRREEAIEGVRTEVVPHQDQAPAQDRGPVQDTETKTASIELGAPRELELPPAEKVRNLPVPARSALVPGLTVLLVAALSLCAWLAYENVQLRKPPVAAAPGNHFVNVLPGKCVSTSAGKGWASTQFPVQTRIFTASFNATPGAASLINDVIAISDGRQTQINKFPVIVAFSETGYILARNGGNYTAFDAIRYTSGVTYHFRLVIDVRAHTYSIYVTPPGGKEIVVGTNFAFRSDVNDVKSLNSVGSLVDSGSGTISFCNFTLN